MLMMDEELKKDLWRKRFYQNLVKHVGTETAIEYFPTLKSELSEEKLYWESDVMKWTVSAIKTLKQKAEPKPCKDILTGCTCHILSETIEKVRKIYLKTGSLDRAHEFMVQDFYQWLGTKSGLDPDSLKYMQENNWGVAGRKEGTKIIATKIPADTVKYFETDRPDLKRYHYCHCPRIKSGLGIKGIEPPHEYCFCGAGFYRAIWEGILDQPVDIQIVKSLLKGDTVCQFQIDLP